MPAQPSPLIQAAVVNHNTSAFSELLLRSLFAAHPHLPNLRVRVDDNASTDDMSGLRSFAEKMAEHRDALLAKFRALGR